MNKVLNYDICVIGGGPAGITSAISASRLGAKVLLVDKDGVPGGMSTNGLLNVWCGNAQSSIFSYVFDKTSKKTASGRKIFSPESLKPLYIDMLTKKGVDILLHSLAVGVEKSGDMITSVSLATKSGEIKVYAKTFIDATGDGDVAYLSGVPFSMGREEDGRTQPMTVELMIGGVDTTRAEFASARHNPFLMEQMQKYLADGRISFPVGLIILVEALEPNTAYCNMTNVIDVDATNVFDVTRAEIEARRQIPQIINFLRENAVGYENCYAITSGVYAGARESRRIKGKYEMSYLDVQEGRKFSDWLVPMADYCFGVHNPNGKVENISTKPVEKGGTYTIPYGAFIPEGVKNLLVAGRCISGDHYAHSSYRVMPICMAMGEGVGTACAIGIKENTLPTELSPKQIKKAQDLILQGIKF
ncbi:MAG: FAD-dependent oxidoreductase [Clostridia bacterium]|nr:FAD-dependent oxidoreductase [Clostridia bacterium]